jgi:hypothetical protein
MRPEKGRHAPSAIPAEAHRSCGEPPPMELLARQPGTRPVSALSSVTPAAACVVTRASRGSTPTQSGRRTESGDQPDGGARLHPAEDADSSCRPRARAHAPRLWPSRRDVDPGPLSDGQSATENTAGHATERPRHVQPERHAHRKRVVIERAPPDTPRASGQNLTLDTRPRSAIDWPESTLSSHWLCGLRLPQWRDEEVRHPVGLDRVRQSAFDVGQKLLSARRWQD